MAEITKKETPAQIQDSDPVVMSFATQKAWTLCLISNMICIALIGWTIRPTKKSATARQHTSVLEGIRRLGVLWTAKRIRKFPTVAETAVSKFITTRAIFVTYVARVSYHSSFKWTQVIFVGVIAVKTSVEVAFSIRSSLLSAWRSTCSTLTKSVYSPGPQVFFSISEWIIFKLFP